MATNPIQITVQDSLTPLVNALDGLSSRRINSIIASTLTAVAAEGQKALKAEVSRVFDRPTQFTLNGTYISRASADNLVATVGFREEAGKGIAAGKYLQAQMYGGQRADKRSEKALQAMGALAAGYQVTPGPSAQIDAYGNQSSGEIVRILSALHAFGEQGYVANRSAASAKRRGARLAQYFVVRVGDKSTRLGPGVYQRVGRGFKKLMSFVPKPTYTVRLQLDQVIAKTIADKFQPLFVYYAEQSIGRLKASQTG